MHSNNEQIICSALHKIAEKNGSLTTCELADAISETIGKYGFEIVAKHTVADLREENEKLKAEIEERKTAFRMLRNVTYGKTPFIYVDTDSLEETEPENGRGPFTKAELFPPKESRGFKFASIECTECGCTVSTFANQPKHADWHNKIADL